MAFLRIALLKEVDVNFLFVNGTFCCVSSIFLVLARFLQHFQLISQRSQQEYLSFTPNFFKVKKIPLKNDHLKFVYD